jgi:hypothetical protein
MSMGGADVILSLPSCCHFEGNTSLVTLALRRMLEDETTLQAMMETEIRSQVTKLFKKQYRGSVGTSERPKASMKPLMQSVTPLICRAPQVFVRALACSVKLEPKGDESSSMSSSRDARVVLLSNEERVKNAKLFGPQMPSNHNSAPSATPHKKSSSQDEHPNRTRGRSKSPHHSKRDKADKAKTPDPKKPVTDSSPPNHISSLLLTKALKDLPNDTELQTKRPFLSIPDYLNILSDLVLAIPSCGAAVHRFMLPYEVHIHHALPGCADPPQTAVSFLLHRLLPQPRTSPGSSFSSTETSENEKKLAVMKTRTSQASARLIVTLIARSGEGRRRVISDLLFALSCGRINNQVLLLPPSDVKRKDTVADGDYEMQTLQTWGEVGI